MTRQRALEPSNKYFVQSVACPYVQVHVGTVCVNKSFNVCCVYSFSASKGGGDLGTCLIEEYFLYIICTTEEQLKCVGGWDSRVDVFLLLFVIPPFGCIASYLILVINILFCVIDWTIKLQNWLWIYLKYSMVVLAFLISFFFSKEG